MYAKEVNHCKSHGHPSTSWHYMVTADILVLFLSCGYGVPLCRKRIEIETLLTLVQHLRSTGIGGDAHNIIAQLRSVWSAS